MPKRNILVLLLAAASLYGCAGMIVGAAVGTVTTVAVETAKVPFKVGGAVVDVVSDDDDDDEDD